MGMQAHPGWIGNSPLVVFDMPLWIWPTSFSEKPENARVDFYKHRQHWMSDPAVEANMRLQLATCRWGETATTGCGCNEHLRVGTVGCRGRWQGPGWTHPPDLPSRPHCPPPTHTPRKNKNQPCHPSRHAVRLRCHLQRSRLAGAHVQVEFVVRRPTWGMESRSVSGPAWFAAHCMAGTFRCRVRGCARARARGGGQAAAASHKPRAKGGRGGHPHP